ncbi:MAG: hypothetical protein WCL39_05255 [Armatimonadota bacterium]
MKILMLMIAAITMTCSGDAAEAQRLDYSQHPVTVQGGGGLTDGLGAESYPSAQDLWASPDVPTAEKPAVLVFDYGSTVKVSALAHYCYMPGSRDQRTTDWLAGPAAFREVKISVSDDNVAWREVAHLTDLPA